jgi:hypothetical protein
MVTIKHMKVTYSLCHDTSAFLIEEIMVKEVTWTRTVTAKLRIFSELSLRDKHNFSLPILFFDDAPGTDRYWAQNIIIVSSSFKDAVSS